MTKSYKIFLQKEEVHVLEQIQEKVNQGNNEEVTLQGIIQTCFLMGYVDLKNMHKIELGCNSNEKN